MPIDFRKITLGFHAAELDEWLQQLYGAPVFTSLKTVNSRLHIIYLARFSHFRLSPKGVVVTS